MAAPSDPHSKFIDFRQGQMILPKVYHSRMLLPYAGLGAPLELFI